MSQKGIVLGEGERSAGVFEEKKSQNRNPTLMRVILKLYLLYFVIMHSWIVYYIKGIKSKTQLMAWQDGLKGTGSCCQARELTLTGWHPGTAHPLIHTVNEQINLVSKLGFSCCKKLLC